MIGLDQAVATAVLGAVAVAVAIWGVWLSVGSSRQGPAWALSQLGRWRRAAPLLLIGGGLATLVFEPFWMGIGVVYIAAVAWWLTSSVRRSLLRTLEVFGDLGDGTPPSAASASAYSRILLGGAGVLALFSVWDVVNRGWPGVFGVVLAVCLGYVGIRVFRA